MTIDILSSSRELFGSDRCAVRLATVLRSLGHDARLVLPSARAERGLAELAASEGVPALASPVAVASSRGLDGIAGLFARRSPPRADLTICNTSAVVAAREPGLQRLLILRECLDPGSLRHRAIAALQARRCREVVAISAAARDRWAACASGAPPARVIPDWLDDHWLEDGAAASGGDREGILFLGRFSVRKGADVLADAYVRAFPGSAERPPLAFLGDEGSQSRFADRAGKLRERGTREGWQVLPFTAHPQIALAGAALVVVPSVLPEGLGDVILEALALGCRVVAAPHGGPAELAAAFPAAVTLAEPTVDGIADALRAWWEDGGRAQSADEHAVTLERLESDYSPRSAARAWAATLEDLAG